MHDAFRAIVPAAAGYLLGSIPISDVVFGPRGVDLRRVGDRNPGYWNARETLGAGAAWPVLAGDVGKGVAAAGIGRAIGRAAAPGQWWPAVVGGGAAMVGHAWPLFAGFRGGRAVATFAGAAAVISPPAAGAAVLAGGAVFGSSGSFARAVRVGFVAFPLAQLAVDGPVRTAATGVLMTFVGIRFLTASRRSVAPAAPPLAPDQAAGEGGDRDHVGGR